MVQAKPKSKGTKGTVLKLDISVGPVIWTANIIALAFVVVLLLRNLIPWRASRFFWTVASIVIGWSVMWVLIAVLFIWLNAFDGPLEHRSLTWLFLGFGAMGLAVRGFWTFRKWWKIIPIVALLSFTVSTTLGVNSAYGITPQLGTFLGLPIEDPVPLPKVTGAPVETVGNLKQTWQPPTDMPDRGVSGLIPGGIPNTASQFPARGATIYLPPAALVANPPKLPLVIFMMGKPGSPDPQFIARELEAHATANKGLAPIAVIVDQLGNPMHDPMCFDGRRGNVDTYISQDVVSWASSNLNIVTSPSQWVISGYSNGGSCAQYFGAKYPTIWGNLLSVSGEEYPGEGVGTVLGEMFKGDKAAWEAVKPSAFLSQNKYPDSMAVFTTGELDTRYGPGMKRFASMAQAAGMKTVVITLPGVDHNNDALIEGIKQGMAVLYPRLGV